MATFFGSAANETITPAFVSSGVTRVPGSFPSAEADVIFGLGGDDTLDGGAGDDVIDGRDGDDVLRGNTGAHDPVGGTGIDTATYTESTAGVNVNRATGVGLFGAAAGDTLSRTGANMPRMYWIVVSDAVEGEPPHAHHIRKTLNNLGLHVKVWEVQRYERLSNDGRRTTQDVLHDVQLHPGSTVSEIASRMYPNEAKGGEADRVRAEAKVRTLANKLVRAEQLRKDFDHGLRFSSKTTEPVCICVPMVGSDGKLIPQPSPDCLIAEHSHLARDLILAAQGRGRL